MTEFLSGCDGLVDYFGILFDGDNMNPQYFNGTCTKV